jgi:hypothetical protein
MAISCACIAEGETSSWRAYSTAAAAAINSGASTCLDLVMRDVDGSGTG